MAAPTSRSCGLGPLALFKFFKLLDFGEKLLAFVPTCFLNSARICSTKRPTHLPAHLKGEYCFAAQITDSVCGVLSSFPEGNFLLRNEYNLSAPA